MRENNKTILTVSELKEILKDWPEKDQNGEDSEVWIMTGDMSSSGVFNVYRLNSTDILFET